jgi:hypothetical protein
MSTDRPPHDDKLLAELAAFDQLLRKPLDPEPRPAPVQPPQPVSALPVDEWLTEPEDLALPSRKAEAARAAALFPAPRRVRAGALSIAALTAGIVVGGPLGWWLAANLFVSRPPMDAIELEPTATVPAATRPAAPSREATRRSASRAAAAASPNVAAPKAAAPNVAAPNVAAPNFAVPAANGSGDAISSIPTAPAPSIDLPPTVAGPSAALPAATPLPSAPLRVGLSTPPSSPLAVAASGAVAAVVAADEAAIERTLRQYKDAYERLDAKAASAVWPTVDQRALTRAFAGLASQSLDFSGCDVVVRAGASKATASCSGMAAYVRKVGDTRVRLEPRQWTFTLNKSQGAWRIETVDGSR